MPRQKNPVPSYLKHRPTGQAFVKIDGKFHYLGAYGSPESRTAYGNLVGRTLRGLDPIAEPKAPSAAVLTACILQVGSRPIRHGKERQQASGEHPARSLLPSPV